MQASKTDKPSATVYQLRKVNEGLRYDLEKLNRKVNEVLANYSPAKPARQAPSQSEDEQLAVLTKRLQLYE